jgi:hypothetical protein
MLYNKYPQGCNFLQQCHNSQPLVVNASCLFFEPFEAYIQCRSSEPEILELHNMEWHIIIVMSKLNPINVNMF